MRRHYLKDVSLLASLPALRDLRIPCNGVASISLPPEAFTTLTSLDLSFNALDAAALLPLSTLRQLKRLNLSCNSISAIPDDALPAGDDNFPELRQGCAIGSCD